MSSDDDPNLDDLDQPPHLNDQAFNLVNQALGASEDLRIEPAPVKGAGCILDCGVEAEGSLAAGLALAEICLSGMAELSIVPGEVAGAHWPHLFVTTDQPVEACLLSQYAGWQISVGKYFAMGSGPMRAAAGREELFAKLGYREAATAVVGVLESGTLPDLKVVRWIAEKCRVAPDRVGLLVAPTSSIAGNLQVVARSVETAMHKLFEVGFDVSEVVSACGVAPISPVAADDLNGIGRTNDAILYGARVTLWIDGDDQQIASLGPKVPASASPAYGEPFLSIFEQAGRDFYKIDPLLFSPAEVVFQNVATGRVQRFGRVNHAVLERSFGL
ncbi:MAG: methenyltetrahydromethanopterin cyclohydrolase [Planctomyces sp.]|nr:methenyltetrahydromethanopterin cyclohydrolase [Planctomyces sp.]